jgi:23S rRNA (guanosine2251-2'-O)-methyltransferase
VAHRKLIFEEIEKARLSPEQALSVKRHPVIGVLEDIRSLYNVGSCFRTADAMLLRQLILTGYTPVPPRKELEKTALGATETVPWHYEPATTAAVIELKSAGWYVAALEITDTAASVDSLDAGGRPCAFVVGNELTGVRSETLEACDGSIVIPMYGVKHSLNVAVAFGIAAWELVQRALRGNHTTGQATIHSDLK